MAWHKTQFPVSTEHYEVWCDTLRDHNHVRQYEHTVRRNNLSITEIYVEYELPVHLFEIGCMFAENLAKAKQLS